MKKLKLQIWLMIATGLATCLSISQATQTYNVTIATDTPASPTIGTAGPAGSGFDLRGAILTANASSNTNIVINFNFGSPQTITLGNHLPMISNYDGASATATPINKTWTFNGNSRVTINGNNLYRGFFLSPVPASPSQSDLPSSGYTQQLNATFNDMAIQNALAKGGNGGGGGMGAGGAGFQNSYTNVTYSNVTFNNCRAQGGTGTYNIGGGGMGGNGGASGAGGGLGGDGAGGSLYGGGGGIGGNGGTCGAGANASGGGGGGFGGTGVGQVLSTVAFSSGGSGTSGGAGGARGGGGGAGGVANAGTASSSTGAGGNATVNNSAAGGGGGVSGVNASGINGGNGGIGGGGGGGAASGFYGPAGNGGFGGGSGSGYGGSSGGFGGGSYGGSGGFGGGSSDGIGGFGGGSAGGDLFAGAYAGGYGGGAGGGFASGVGGGAGFGGALFARNGSSLTIKGPASFGGSTGNTAVGGAGNGGGNGTGAGQDLFVMGTSSSATTVNLDTTAGNITFNGTIADDNGNNSSLGAKLSISGTNRVILNTANTYIGGPDIQQGILVMNNASALGSSTSTITMGTATTGGTLLLGGAYTIANPIVLSSTQTSTVDINSYTPTLSGVISGGGATLALTNSGGATRVLSVTGANTYSGTTSIGAFVTLSLSGSGTTGTSSINLAAATSSIDMSAIPSASLTLGDLNGTQGQVIIGSKSLSIGTAASTADFGGVIQGVGGSVTKVGSGKAILSGTNTYTGGTTVTAGTLQIGNGGTTGGVVGNITNNAALIFNRSDDLVYSNVISGSGSLEKQGAGKFTVNTTQTYSGGTTITAGALQIGNGSTVGSITGNINNNAALIFNRSDAVTYTSTISGTGSLTKQGASSLTLSAANTYSGGTTIANGTVIINHHQSLGTGAVTFTGTGTTLEIGSALSGAIANAITVNANSNLDTQGYNITLSGTITGTSTLRKLGTGILTLASANAFNGVILDLDTVAIGNNQALGSGTFTFNNAGTKLIIAGNLNNVANPMALTANGIIDTNGNTATLTGTLTGTGDLTKDGTGTLQITTANPGYSGDVVANAGELKVNGSLPNSNVTVANVARFTGNATVNNLVNSGIVKPGNSIGTVQVLANFDNTNGTYNCEINDASQSDLIQVTGTATLGGTLNVLPQPGDYRTPKTYTILTAGNPIVTQFTTVTSTSALLGYTLNYLANSVQLTAVQTFTLNDVVSEGNPGGVADYIISHNPPPGSQLGQLLDVLATLPLNELYEALNQLQPSANVLVGATIGKSEMGQADELFSSFTMEETLKRLHNTKKKNTAVKQISQMVSRLAMPMSQSLNSLYASKGSPNYASQYNLLPQGQEAPQNMSVSYGNTTLWLQQTGVYSKRRAVQDGSPTIGTPGVRSKLSTTTVGSTTKVSEDLLVGGSLSYTKRLYRLQRNYGKGRINSYSGGLYGQWRPQASWYVKAAGFYGHHAFKGARHLKLRSAVYANTQRHEGEHVSGAVEVGHDMELTSTLTVTGYGGLSGLFFKERGYRENSQGLNPSLKVVGRSTRFTQSRIGVQVTHSLLRDELPVYLQGRVAYIYRRHLDNPQRVIASMNEYEDTFTVKVNDKQQRILQTGIGIAAALTEDLSLSLNYNNEWSSSERLNRLLLELNYRF
ncbi:autotransporter domain-containing protein [Candidatus Odyssella thessalonicensis]|uniref:autotransporter domain-containing protein n=1 Tax=Candidatus Odyssella thessalonicensis TaxID=84647 RepID=UPI000225C170|nr:autotransporter domain-containing protein [Candidatus Odyssella thessalonicensis]